MKRKTISLTAALFAAILITSTVFAGSVKFSNVTFSLGTGGSFSSLAKVAALVAVEDQANPPSLVANGLLSGLGQQDVTIKLDASGFPDVICTNQGGNMAPGQNPPKVSTNGEQLLFGLDFTSKNGKSPFSVATDDPPAELDAIEYGCPNSNWDAAITFVYWTDATISVYDSDMNLLRSQDYTCTTTLTSVTCKPVN